MLCLENFRRVSNLEMFGLECCGVVSSCNV